MKKCVFLLPLLALSGCAKDTNPPVASQLTHNQDHHQARLSTSLTNEVPTPHSLNSGWRFVRDIEDRDALTQVNWTEVTLPHTPKVEPMIVNNQWQGTAWYQRALPWSDSWQDKVVLIRFEAAMKVADVWLNGKKIGHHKGGYLPFTLDLTDHLQPGDNTLLVKLDNRDNELIGPKPLSTLDFNTYGGLYRSVSLVVKEPVHITDELLANKVAGGGVFVTYPTVDEAQSLVNVTTHLHNRSAANKQVTVRQTLHFNDEVILSEEQRIVLPAGADQILEQQLTVEQPRLWSPDAPNLYELETALLHNDELMERQSRKIGIREFAFNDNHELLINGEQVFLRGVNRHQEYPHVGYALSPQADYRDAVRIKSAGFNYVRLSHYPHSPAFMKAADELGLVLLNAILGWQFYNPDPAFQAQVIETCRDLIRRDRNHPSVMAWECSLNESAMPKEFVAELDNIVKEEYPGAFSAGWMHGYDIYLQARQHRLKHYEEPTQPYNVSEYGDWEYYAQNAGLNQDDWQGLKEDERTSRQLLGSGEKRLLQQATNIQEAHNDNLQTPAYADGYWVMFDYNRGYADDIEASGIMSVYRQPKYSYYFYQSQRSPDHESAAYDSGPMVFIASDWQSNSSTDVRVYSNADEVALYLNDQLVERKSPQRNRLSSHLSHPPFIFSLAEFTPGSLRAEAYIDGQQVAQHEVVTPGEAERLTLAVDTAGVAIASESPDLIFVYAQLRDANGNPVYDNGIPISLTVTGNLELVNPEPVVSERGQGAFLIKTFGEPDGATITVESPALGAASYTF